MIDNLPSVALSGFLGLTATTLNGTGHTASQATTPGRTITSTVTVTRSPIGPGDAVAGIEVSDDGVTWTAVAATSPATMTETPSTVSTVPLAVVWTNAFTFTAKSFARITWDAGLNAAAITVSVASSST